MKKPKDRDEYRQRLAEEFAGVLEEHGLSWTQEWARTTPELPYNAITKAKYHGNNSFLLAVISMVKGYDDPRWVTMVQIMDKNGKYHAKQKWHLQKGSEATWVEYWYPFDLEEKKALTWEEYRDALKDGRKEDEFRLCTKYTAVYNACQVDGMPELPRQPLTTGEKKPDEILAALSRNMGVPILNDGGGSAFYRPSEDTVHLPKAELFESEYSYNATALHELAHATGHESRLNRDQSGTFGDAKYAYEELIAEMASCFMGVNLTAEASEFHIQNHKAYVQNWIEHIRNKPDSLIHAIKDAQIAANYMDYKAELITLEEYNKTSGHVVEVPVQQTAPAIVEEPAAMIPVCKNEIYKLGESAGTGYYFMSQQLDKAILGRIIEPSDQYVMIAYKSYLSDDWMAAHSVTFWKVDRDITLPEVRSLAERLGATDRTLYGIDRQIELAQLPPSPLRYTGMEV
jgi:antirestriction protein ArdC